MGVGRVICVALPFGLTLASLICILIAMLSGATSHNLDMFEVNTKNMSISSSSLANLVSEVTKRDASPSGNSLSALTIAGLEPNTGSATSTNFTASSFGLADSYKVFLWNYCAITGTNTTCTKAKFNWAASSLNVTALNAKASAVSEAAAGTNATLPKDITSALKSYIAVSKWTQVVYIIALLFTALTLLTGLFGFCSRAGSCITYLLSGLATTSLLAASLMATLSSAVVVAAVKTSAKAYGVTASLQRPFLSVTWLAVAFSIGSGIFWLASICCCKPEHRSSKRQSEKFGPSAYTPIHGETAYNGQPQQQGLAYGGQQQQHMKPTRGAGYEPYSHANV